MSVNIVLVEPLIPQYTGTIARMTAAIKTKLHLIEPLGFKLTDKYLKRAGLDYWPEVEIAIYPNWEKFIEQNNVEENRMWFFSTHAENSYFDVQYEKNDYFVFCNESFGLSDFYHQRYAKQRLSIPMMNEEVRSLNLSNACSVVMYEAIRQLRLYGK